MEKLTSKQKEFLEILKQFINVNKYVPTIREFGAYIGLNSPATVKFYFDNLQKKGYIKRINNRMIEIIEEQENANN